ncbi:transcription antitermination factor NusB [Streptococcus mitis]|uniref:Transcription antitermination protein NusB n=1 Tax=Streptococcus mitis TaxID=28037 RepID=A0A1X1KS36_STRMT|nr:transcription antitermination factor NusB [Streptococcus mitis]ORO92372.1 N utilization substance protein B [Streptococcus mitis]ORP02248.1 N utilization substance protein B [Streptococcus mitis]
MTSPLLESRRELRKCAFQALMSLEFGTDMETACRFAYTHDREDVDVQIPAFLLNLVSGIQDQKEELDKQINQHLKSGWTVERLTLVEKNLLRLGIFEITSFDTPQLVAVNEAIELAKNFSDQKSARFINGLLSQFVTEENE